MYFYFKELREGIGNIKVSDKSRKILDLQDVLNDIVKILKNYIKNDGRIFVIGNGGSAAIAAHTVNDLIRNCSLPGVALSEAAVLTCMSNDLGYENVYAEQIRLLMHEQDLLIAISSSGNSVNILNAVKEAKKKKCCVLTLSGFKEDNMLRTMGDWNIYIPSMEYGIVELSHQIILHYLTDYIKKENSK